MSDADQPQADGLPELPRVPPAKTSRVPVVPAPTHCANCGTRLQGPYCHQCGQHAKSVLRHLPGLIADGMDIVFNLDGRIVHTLPALYLHPGRLTLEYFAGRRMRYISPFRLLFVFTIIAFFAIQLSLRVGFADGAQVNVVAPTTHGLVASNDGTNPAAAVSAAGSRIPMFTGKGHPVHITWLPALANDYLTGAIARSGHHLHRLFHGSLSQRKAEGKQLIIGMFAVAPSVLFVLLPIFALMLTVFYIFKRRLYVEHLIVAMHSHAFIMFSLLILVILSALHAWVVPHAGWLAAPFWLLKAAAWLWIGAYLLMMQKRVYRQGWFMTGVKYATIGLCYSVLLALALAAASLLALAR
jgi:hypothetical protein